MAEDVDDLSPRMPAERPGRLTCASCGQSMDPVLRIGTLAICSVCGASLNIDADGTVRRANRQDTAVLTPTELLTLSQAHAAIARASRRPR